MSTSRKIGLAIAFCFLVPLSANGCSWAAGYFYQVTALKGRVVGTGVTFLQFFPRVRHLFARDHATLRLYEYREHLLPPDLPFVKQADADATGKFDFGFVAAGHYTLAIGDSQLGSDYFFVQITTLPRQTESVTIDVSPNFPDCTGGHEIIVNSKSGN